MSKPTFNLEKNYDHSVIGIDEAGRGPWAGPVVVAGVMFKSYENLPEWVSHLNDSKKISTAKRSILANEIQNSNAILAYHISTIDIEIIDRVNILEATMVGMRQCIDALRNNNEEVFVDGNRKPISEDWCRPIIKGDSLSISIAAASILAKVHRDHIMSKLAIIYPEYGWETNAGYGTARHQAALKEHGITPHHRKSFAPIRAMGV